MKKIEKRNQLMMGSHFLLLIATFMFGGNGIVAHQGMIGPLLGSRADVFYERSTQGKPSRSILIAGLESFKQSVLENNAPVVLRIVSLGSEKKLRDNALAIHHRLAQEHGPIQRVDFAVLHVDDPRNKPIVQNLIKILLLLLVGKQAAKIILKSGDLSVLGKLLHSMSAGKEQNPHQVAHVLVQRRVATVLENLHTGLHSPQQMPPLFLFFRDKSLIIPSVTTYASSQDLRRDIMRQFSSDLQQQTIDAERPPETSPAKTNQGWLKRLKLWWRGN